MNGFGEKFQEVRPGQRQLRASQVNQFIRPASAFTHLDVGRGLAMRQLAGGVPSLGLSSDVFAHAITDDEGIPGCDDSDPDLIVPGEGWIYVYVSTIDGYKKKAMKERCKNWWPDEIPAETRLDAVKTNGYWEPFAVMCAAS